MILKIYAIRDIKMQEYMSPFYLTNDAVAIREFTNAKVADQPNPVNTNPEDKELWCLGDYDSNSGIINSNVRFITKASDVGV